MKYPNTFGNNFRWTDENGKQDYNKGIYIDHLWGLEYVIPEKIIKE